MTYSFSFTFSGKHFICPSILNDSFAGWSNLGCRSLLFITLNTFCQSLLATKFLLRNQLIVLRELLLVTLCLFLTVFKILSLSLTFGILIMMCLDVVLLGPTCLGLSVLPGLGCLFSSPN